jgi:hypothetical protein
VDAPDRAVRGGRASAPKDEEEGPEARVLHTDPEIVIFGTGDRFAGESAPAESLTRISEGRTDCNIRGEASKWGPS